MSRSEAPPMNRSFSLRQRHPIRAALLLAVAILLPASGSGQARAGPGKAELRKITPRARLLPSEVANIQLFERATGSVVHITNIATRQDWFTLDILKIPQGTGSGFIWDKQGHIVTNFHVIEGGHEFLVTLADQSTWKAKVTGYEADKDLAVLEIGAPRSKLTPIPLGRSKDLRVGQSVFAIGNPFGLDHTLTTGVISGLGREIQSVTRRPIQDVIQTDAAINPGNSGGPLLDSAGRLIGVNTAIYSPSGTYIGIGFAVPVDTVNRIASQLIAYGRVIRPGLGITMVPDKTVQRLDMEGVVILEARPGSAAEKAGLRSTQRTRRGQIILGDVIIAIDGEPVTGSNDLYRILDHHDVGDEVTVTILRGSGKKKLKLTLQAL